MILESMELKFYQFLSKETNL